MTAARRTDPALELEALVSAQPCQFGEIVLIAAQSHQPFISHHHLPLRPAFRSIAIQRASP